MKQLKLPDAIAGFQQIVNGFIETGDRVTFPWGPGRDVSEVIPEMEGWPVEVANIMELKVYRRMPVARQGDIDHPRVPQENARVDTAISAAESLWESFKDTPRSYLPSDASQRKNIPIATGVLDYFPDAIAAIAKVSKAGNDQHNPGSVLHWDRSKSGDEADAMMRHFMERGKLDCDGISHSAKMAWRALAFLQKEIEGERNHDRPCSESLPTARCCPGQAGMAPASVR